MPEGFGEERFGRFEMIVIKEIPLAFKCKNQQIAGILHLPQRKNPPIIIMCHGWGSNKLGTWQGLFVKFAREICKNGFAVLRFDFRGSGDSEGDFGEQTIETMLDDLDCVLNNLDKDIVNIDKIGLIGHSLGGKAAILKAAEDKRIKCLALLSTPASQKNAMTIDFIDEVRERKKLLLGDSGLWINKNQLESYLKYDGLKAIRKVRIPVLVASGSEDLSVFPSHSEKLYKVANKPKKLIFVKGADHFFLVDDFKKELFGITIKWFKKWFTTSGSK
jgi:pimeloyl-ACP methyl ester carboxylesterase